MRKAKTELTAENVRKTIEEKKPTSMTQLAHGLGYRGSVSGGLTRKLRVLVPDIDSLLAGKAEPAKGANGDAPAPRKPPKAGKAAKPAAGDGKPTTGKPDAKAKGKWPRDPRNPFREGSSYGVCYDILAAHKAGLPKEKLVALLAEATGKDSKRAGYDAQVVLSARPNEDGLNNNDSPRNRSCRPGFWVRRENDHVTLVVDRQEAP